MANPGDIALVGYSSDVGGKSFAFVLLADLSGETIFFTDNGWFAAGGFRANEGTTSYVVPAGTAVGTVVTISGLTGTLNPSTAGDQILAYTGSAASPTFLFAIDFADGNTSFAGEATSSNTSAVPTGLTFGTTALAFGGDNGAYAGPLSGTRAEILAAIANAANWTLDEAVLPTYPGNFTVTAGSAATVSINDVALVEGNSGTSSLVFTVTRSDNTGAFTVDFATANGTATAVSDYAATSGTLSFTAGGALTQTVSVTINGDTATEANEQFTVALSNLVNTSGTAAIADASGTGTITNDDTNLTAIHAIQGAGHVSSFVGQVVITQGIVTAVDSNGFYLQTPDGLADGDVRTSEALFVFTNTAPTVAVGDLLTVTGTVSEFIPGGASTNNLSTTQISGAVINVVSSGNALPSAIILGAAGRPAPTSIVDDDNFALFDPATDGIDFYESLEGMLVTVPQPLVVAPTTSFGEIFTVADNGAAATGLSARGTIVTRGSTGDGLAVTNTGAGADYNPERIQIDGDSFTPGGANAIPFVNTGTLLNDVTGVLSYNFGNYEVLATSAVTVASPSLLADDVTTLAAGPATLTIASYNVLNLDPTDPAARFTNLALDIVGPLATPDIIALQEIQDNNGAVNDGVVSASMTLQMLVDAIAANGGPTYSFIDNPFITDDTNGGEPGGNIRAAYLYNPARVDLVEGSVATTPDAATDFANSRPPLIATFGFNGEEVTVINNHFTSKGGSSPLFGAVQPSLNGGAAERLIQAQNVADYVASLDPAKKVVVLGDLNEFANEESLAPLTTAGLVNLSLGLAATERYSYNFEGNAQQLDQALVSGSLSSVAALDIIHLNSEYVATSTSAADHDPLVVALTLPPSPGLAVGGINVYDAPEGLAGLIDTPVATDDLAMVRLGSIQGTVPGAESIAYADGRVYVTALAANAINVHSITAAGALVNEAPIALSSLPSYRPGGVNAVAVANGVLAVAYENVDAAANGFVALFNTADNSLIKTIEVGVLPDDVTFTPDGLKLLVANEAEALSANGSISIIDLSAGAANAVVSNTIGFTSLNGFEDALRDRGLAIAPGQPAAGDIEPEYVTISDDGTRAYVTLQEVNAVAVIDLTDPTADRPLAIQPLGTIDRSLPGNALDASDRDGPGGTAAIDLRNADIQSLLQPDAIASFAVGGVTYFVTANEGDARVNVADEVRLNSASYVLDPTAFPNAAAIKANAELGRLNVLNTIGDTDGDGDFDVIHTYGGRGISIFRQEADGSITKVRETGGEFEAILAATVPGSFNSDQSTNPNSFDTRSDNKGPEPEGVTIGVIGGRTYAFVGLERIGGQMVYDVTDPANAFFVTYRPQTAQDLGPETNLFISAADSPTGQALLLSANEISNSVTLYSVLPQTDGNDRLQGGSGDDDFNGKGGNDRVNGDAGNDLIDGGAGDDLLDGGEGIDTVSYASASNGVSIRLGVQRQIDNGNAGVDTLTGFENVEGSALNDRLEGSASANTLLGGNGNDVLIGARGADVLVGGNGNDVLIGGLDADIFRFDTLEDGSFDVITDYSASNDQLLFGTGITITSVAVSFAAIGASLNGQPLENGNRSLDLVLTLSDGNGATQTLFVLDAYSSGLNNYWEAQLGRDLTYPRPLPTGTEQLIIG